MNALLATVLACLSGGVLATAAAAGTLVLPPSRIGRLVSFAVGALLGAVFLELLPHALEHGAPQGVMITVLCGLLAFFLLEKLVLWRHSHGEAEASAHPHGHVPGELHDSGRSGLMILIGNSVHNFCDGIVIAASFLANPALGIATTVAIIAHAIPQQVGDFAILIMSGFRRSKAFAYNVATGSATLLGGLVGYLFLARMEDLLPTVLALAAASLLYVSVADLIPALHRRAEPLETAKQLVLIGLGIGVIALVHVLLEP
ncbi:MAG: ZIP family metal transporter [Pseudomonadota bacterium]|nr:ZIP family metal transporter [Pseudomonadota bacterium]